MAKNKIPVSIGLLLCGLVVFVLGNPYYRVFPTNGNQAFYIALTLSFLVLALAMKRSAKLSRFSPAAYAFFIASAATLVLSSGILNLTVRSGNPLKEIALDKLFQFLHVVPVILVLTLVAGHDLRSIFIRKGNLKKGLIFGLVSFAGFAILGAIIQVGSLDFLANLPNAIPWLLLFVFANAIMEELWFRGIFLEKFEPLVGRNLAILVTAIAFGASHINATYDFPGGGLVFGIVVFGLGWVGARSMFDTDSLIGAVLFHAGYDLVIIMPIINSL